MIVSMKKVYVITQDKDVSLAVGALKSFGALHIEHEQSPLSDDVNKLKEQIDTVSRVIEFLSIKQEKQGNMATDQWLETAQRIVRTQEEIHELQDEMISRKMVIQQWEPWGDFSLKDINYLKNHGIYLGLYRIPLKALKSIGEDIVLQVVFRFSGMAYCVVVSDYEIKLDFEQIKFPETGLSQLKILQSQDADKLEKKEKRLKEMAQYRQYYLELIEQLKMELKTKEAIAAVKQAESLAYLKGFCPKPSCESLRHYAKRKKWGLIMEDPGEGERVPTMLRNPRWVEIIQPVFRMMNILPGYCEVDISLFFLIFFSVFFGMLIGDAGYGLVFAGLTIWGHLKTKGKPNQSLFILMYVLSGCAVIWGVLTGTFFGQKWLAGNIQPLLPWLADNTHIQKLCFLIGAIHLSIAHAWRALIKWPSKSVVSEFGWLSLLWGMYFLAKLLILNQPLPPFSNVLFIGGALGVIFFSKPQKNILKGMAVGLGELLINVLNTFTDVVSYIRLFAVGLATVAVADAFNQMAAEIGMGSFLSGLAMSLILVFGHLLNILLGAMAILVHGVRLNVLEFSSHLNMEWSGIPYDPLRETKNIKV